MNNSFDYITNNTIVIVPCYNAEKTIVKTITEIQSTGFKNIVISDDSSSDNTYNIIKEHFSDINLIRQKKNLGYGGNQKVLYDYAKEKSYKYLIMIHGDNQYSARLIPSMIYMLHFAGYDFVFGSRILGGNALKGGMPILKYLANRVLTLIQNLITGYKLSEYHSGLRSYKINLIKTIDYNKYSNNFFFDNQIILKIIEKKKNIGEVSCQTKYETNSSSISYLESARYAMQVLLLTFKHLIFRITN